MPPPTAVIKLLSKGTLEIRKPAWLLDFSGFRNHSHSLLEKEFSVITAIHNAIKKVQYCRIFSLFSLSYKFYRTTIVPFIKIYLIFCYAVFMLIKLTCNGLICIWIKMCVCTINNFWCITYPVCNCVCSVAELNK